MYRVEAHRTMGPPIFAFAIGLSHFLAFSFVIRSPSSSIGCTPILRQDRPEVWSTADSATEDPASNEVAESDDRVGVIHMEELTCPNATSSSNASSTAATLDGRLLCASECAYGIRYPYFRAASFLPSTTAKILSKGVNSALIGQTTDGIVIAFRGTKSSSPLDWLQNAAILLKKVDTIPGKIHSGFYSAVVSLWEPLRRELGDILGRYDHTPAIYLTGHSKGGALASLAALLLASDPSLPNATFVVSFASPKIGNTEFARYFNSTVHQRTFENHFDIVPFLPPSQATMDSMDPNMTTMVNEMMWSETTPKSKRTANWDYQSVGHRRFIDKDGTLKTELSPELDVQRIIDIENKTILSFSAFRAAHCSSCPSDSCSGGYFSAIAPEVCDMI
jgi:hypothetical protein